MRYGKPFSSLSRSGRSLAVKHEFDLKTKSLAKTDLEVTLLIHIRFLNVILPLPFTRRKASLTAAKECFLRWDPLRLEGLCERLSFPSGSGWSPATKRFWCICGLKLKYGERLSSLIGSERSPAAKHAFLSENNISRDGGFRSNLSRSSPPLPLTATPVPRRKAPQSAGRECSLP
jgi:hypothetical protein